MVRNRPYSIGMIEHFQSLSSIILFTENVDQPIVDDKPKDFFTDFSDKVKDVIIKSSPGTEIQPPIGNIWRGQLGSAPGDYYGVFNNFSIMAVREAHDEIVKIHQNFDNSWNVFFFGERPAVYSFNGIFVDSMDYPYYQEFMVAYDTLLAGRKCIENNMKMYLTCDNKIIEGYMLNISATKTAETSFKKDFSFSLLVRNVYWVRNNIIVSTAPNGQTVFRLGYNELSNIARFPLTEEVNFASGL